MNIQMQNRISQQKRKYIERHRNRVLLRLRLSNGVRELTKRPWKLALLLALVVLVVLAWENRGKVAFATAIPAISAVWAYVVEILIVMLAMLAVLGLLVLLGTPCQAKRIEAAMAHACVTDCYGFPPILVSWHRDKSTGISTMAFFSRGISKEAWERKRRDIEDVLNVRWIEEARYGGKRGDNGNYITLTVASGTGAAGRCEVLYDDEL